MIDIHVEKLFKEVVMKKRSSNIVSFWLMLGLLVALNTNDLTLAQQFNKINSDIPGGGSGSTNTEVQSDDNTLLYVVGGAVVVGIVVYALMQNKKGKSIKDTTTAFLDSDLLRQRLSLSENISNVQLQIPVNILFGMQNNFLRKEEKRYYVGLAYNF